MKPRIYVDTSVIGGVYDEEFDTWSKKLFQEFQKGEKVFVLSDLTLREVEDAPEHIKAVVDGVPSAYREYVFLSEEAKSLANLYIQEGAINRKYLVDAQHISIATISHVDVLVSWNFKHIVNLEKIRFYNSVNIKYGHQMIEIRNPREVLHDG